MLNIEPSNLWAEYQAAKRFRDAHLETLNERVRRFTGPAYSGKTFEDFDPESHEYEYISLVLPRVFFDSPRVRVSTIRQGPMQDLALALQAGLNRWIREVRLRNVLTEVGTDMLLSWGMALVTMEPNMSRIVPDSVRATTGYSGTPFRPVVQRISPKRTFWDPMALTYSEARYIGHEWTRDKDDLLLQAQATPEEGWLIDVIAGLSEDAGLGDLRNDMKDREAPSRREVMGVTIYIKGYQIEGQPGPDQGFNGALVEMAMSSSGFVLIRQPRMFYGPASGPYYMFGVYTVPDNSIPLSPTAAMATQVAVLNMHAKAVSQAAARRKRVAFTNDRDPKLADIVANCKDGEVVQINTDELNNNLKEVELGGVTDSALQGLQIERERRDRISGLSDAMRGNVSGEATATENSIASEASGTRMAFIRAQAYEATAQMLRAVAWYLYYDERVVFPVDPQFAQMPGQAIPGQEPWYVGGNPQMGSGATFEDLDLDIEPYSMERTSEQLQQKRLMELTNIIGQVLPAAMQAPINLRELFNLLGNFANVPELSKVVNIPAAEMLQAMMLQGAMQPGMPTQQARLGGDVGMSPMGGSMPAGTASGMQAMQGLTPMGSQGMNDRTM